MPGSLLGNVVRRVEDPDLLTGRAAYVDDLPADGALQLTFVRSPVAHARIRSIDTGEAAAMPGVVAVATAADLGLPPVPAFMKLHELCVRPALAEGKVLFVGDPVVVIAAESRAAALDAAEAVVVDYDPLPAVADPEAALAPGAPVLLDALGSNLAAGRREGSPEPLAGADVVVRGRFENQRVAVVPMEGNAILVVPGGAGEPAITVYVSTQMPHRFHTDVCAVTGLAADDVRVVAPYVGGAFGAKAGMAAEHHVAIGLARRLGRPVRWAETRSENLVAMPHGRGQVQYVELGLTRDGTITGLRCRMIGDAGAYGGFGGLLVTATTRMMAQGVYRIPQIAYETAVAVTNTTPMGAFRGAGRPEAAAFLERIVDLAADELGIDPVELRRRNFLAPEDFPYTTLMDTTYDNGDYDAALTEALRLAGYDDLRAEQAERREHDDARLLGIGVAAYVEVTGSSGNEFAGIAVGDDGTVTVRVGTSGHGQGHPTSFAMIVADRLGVPLEAVRFVQSDTALVPRGGGTGGSRSLQLGGSAVLGATEAVLQRGRELAAQLLEADVDDIVVTDDGRVGVAGVPATALDVDRAGARGGRRGIRARSRARLLATGRDVPVRRARRRRRDRPRHRAGRAPPSRRGRRLRPDAEPDARRGPAARWDRAGCRAGAVRAGRLRRRRQPADREPRRLLHAQRRRAALVRDGQHRDPDAHEPARRQGHRRIGHDRLDARGAERRRRRAQPPRDPSPRHALHPGARLARDRRRAGRPARAALA